MKQLAATYDLESYKRLFVANIYVPKHPTQKKFSYVLDAERDSIESQYETIGRLLKFMGDPDYLIIGYNSQSYDDLLIRHMRTLNNEGSPIDAKTDYLTRELQEATATIIEHGKSEFTKALKYSKSMPNSLDLFALLNPLPSLKKVEIRLRSRNVQDLPYPPSYDEPFTQEQVDEVVDYCWNDVMETHNLYEQHGKGAHQLRVSLQDLFDIKAPKLESLSEPQVAERTMMELYGRKTGCYGQTLRTMAEATTEHYISMEQPIRFADVIPDMIAFDDHDLATMLDTLKSKSTPVSTSGHPSTTILQNTITLGETSYQMGGGGLHSVDEPGVITPRSPTAQLIDVDVASYYPAILINNKLHPAHLEESFSALYQQIRDERIRIKRANSKDPNAHALKIVINSLFGKTASRYSPFYDPSITLAITITGQLALLMLIEMFEDQSIKVVSANTDGVTVELEEYDTASFKEICEIWQEMTDFELEETHYAKIARRDVNNYCALTTDGDIKRKGIFTRPDLKHDVKASVVQQMAENHLLFDQPIHPDALPEKPTLFDYFYHFSATKGFAVAHDDMTGAAKGYNEWTVRLKNGEVKTKRQVPKPKNIHPDHPDPKVVPPVPPKSSLTLQKSNRWYISTDPAYADHVIRKTGGKEGKPIRTISVPNSDRSKIMNLVDQEDPYLLPDDLDVDYYIEQAKKLVKSVTGEPK
jgi:hypothetical protein